LLITRGRVALEDGVTIRIKSVSDSKTTLANAAPRAFYLFIFMFCVAFGAVLFTCNCSKIIFGDHFDGAWVDVDDDETI
jgi:hypothetical protein